MDRGKGLVKQGFSAMLCSTAFQNLLTLEEKIGCHIKAGTIQLVWCVSEKWAHISRRK